MMESPMGKAVDPPAEQQRAAGVGPADAPECPTANDWKSQTQTDHKNWGGGQRSSNWDQQGDWRKKSHHSKQDDWGKKENWNSKKSWNNKDNWQKKDSWAKTGSWRNQNGWDDSSSGSGSGQQTQQAGTGGRGKDTPNDTYHQRGTGSDHGWGNTFFGGGSGKQTPQAGADFHGKLTADGTYPQRSAGYDTWIQPDQQGPNSAWTGAPTQTPTVTQLPDPFWVLPPRVDPSSASGHRSIVQLLTQSPNQLVRDDGAYDANMGGTTAVGTPGNYDANVGGVTAVGTPAPAIAAIPTPTTQAPTPTRGGMGPYRLPEAGAAGPRTNFLNEFATRAHGIRQQYKQHKSIWTRRATAAECNWRGMPRATWIAFHSSDLEAALEGRRCTTCLTTLPQQFFSATQWGSSSKRCLTCIDDPHANTTTAAGMLREGDLWAALPPWDDLEAPDSAEARAKDPRLYPVELQ
jgi:hypothetical protein